MLSFETYDTASEYRQFVIPTTELTDVLRN